MAGLRQRLSQLRLHKLLVFAVLGLGIAVRVWHFPAVPPGLNQDEAASAYEAFSLTQTGCDKWGNPWPVYFPAWGSGQNVLLAYLTIPVIKAFGLSIFAARLVPLLLGLLTLPLFYYCLRPLGRYPALLGLLLLAVAPWHFMLSRWGLESNLLPFWMLLGCTTLSRAISTQRRRWIYSLAAAFCPGALCLRHHVCGAAYHAGNGAVSLLWAYPAAAGGVAAGGGAVHTRGQPAYVVSGGKLCARP